MPSVSDKQHKFMNAIAHDAKFAQKVGVPQKVGEDFVKADKEKEEKPAKKDKKKSKMDKMYPSMSEKAAIEDDEEGD